MKYTRLPCLILLLSSVAGAAEPAPSAAASCAACHGTDGNSPNAEWPSLAGQNQRYLIDQINAFRTGVRDNALMAPMIAALRDTDVLALAAWYSALPPMAPGPADPDLVAQGRSLSAYCMPCHGASGQTANDDWPNLAGQHAQYLQNQLLAYRSGARLNPHMQLIVQRFGPEQFKALAAFYRQLEQ